MPDDAASTYKRRAAQVLDGVEFGPKRLLTMTEAEILALDGPDAKRVTPILTLGETVPEPQRAFAITQAAESMFDRGVVEDGTPLGGTESDAPEPTVRTILRMRRSWLGVLLIDQRTALGRQWVTVYLRADGRALIEAATSDGLHTFSAMKRAAALDAATANLTPIPDATDADDDGVVYRSEVWHEEAGATLSEAKIVNIVVSKRTDRSRQSLVDERFGVYNFADRTEALWADDPEYVRLAPISRVTLRERLELMTRPLAPGEASHDA